MAISVDMPAEPLSLARMRAANTAELTHSRTDLSNSIDRFSRLFSSMAERDGKLLLADKTDNLWVRMDTQDIEEILGNLLDNALKWSKKTVQMTAAKAKDGIVISIEDDGPGIPEQDLPRIWERLYRGDQSRSERGLGLGLSFVKAIAEAHGGPAVVVSRPDEGAQFELRVPVARTGS